MGRGWKRWGNGTALLLGACWVACVGGQTGDPGLGDPSGSVPDVPMHAKPPRYPLPPDTGGSPSSACPIESVEIDTDARRGLVWSALQSQTFAVETALADGQWLVADRAGGVRKCRREAGALRCGAGLSLERAPQGLWPIAGMAERALVVTHGAAFLLNVAGATPALIEAVPLGGLVKESRVVVGSLGPVLVLLLRGGLVSQPFECSHQPDFVELARYSVSEERLAPLASMELSLPESVGTTRLYFDGDLALFVADPPVFNAASHALLRLLRPAEPAASVLSSLSLSGETNGHVWLRNGVLELVTATPSDELLANGEPAERLDNAYQRYDWPADGEPELLARCAFTSVRGAQTVLLDGGGVLARIDAAPPYAPFSTQPSDGHVVRWTGDGCEGSALTLPADATLVPVTESQVVALSSAVDAYDRYTRGPVTATLYDFAVADAPISELSVPADDTFWLRSALSVKGPTGPPVVLIPSARREASGERLFQLSVTDDGLTMGDTLNGAFAVVPFGDRFLAAGGQELFELRAGADGLLEPGARGPVFPWAQHALFQAGHAGWLQLYQRVLASPFWAPDTQVAQWQPDQDAAWRTQVLPYPSDTFRVGGVIASAPLPDISCSALAGGAVRIYDDVTDDGLVMLAEVPGMLASGSSCDDWASVDRNRVSVGKYAIGLRDIDGAREDWRVSVLSVEDPQAPALHELELVHDDRGPTVLAGGDEHAYVLSRRPIPDSHNVEYLLRLVTLEAGREPTVSEPVGLPGVMLAGRGDQVVYVRTPLSVEGGERSLHRVALMDGEAHIEQSVPIGPAIPLTGFLTGSGVLVLPDHTGVVLRDPMTLAELGRLDFSYRTRAVVEHDGLLVLASDVGVDIVDIEDPAAPGLKERFPGARVADQADGRLLLIHSATELVDGPGRVEALTLSR